MELLVPFVQQAHLTLGLDLLVCHVYPVLLILNLQELVPWGLQQISVCVSVMLDIMDLDMIVMHVQKALLNPKLVIFHVNPAVCVTPMPLTVRLVQLLLSTILLHVFAMLVLLAMGIPVPSVPQAPLNPWLGITHVNPVPLVISMQPILPFVQLALSIILLLAVVMQAILELG